MTADAAYRAQLQAAAAVLKKEDHFLLTCHVDPDPDCIGSMLALDWAIRSMGKQSLPVSPDPLLPQWQFFPWQDRVRAPQQVDTDDWEILVVVDCEANRTGPMAVWAKSARLVINIDHHVTNPKQADVMLLNTDAAATAELVYDLIGELGLNLTPPVATLLYAALMADTGAFRFSNTNARVLRLAANLVEKGATPDVIAREIYDTRSWAYVQLLRRVLATLELGCNGQAAWATLSALDMAAAGVQKDESEGMIQFPRMIQGVEVAMLFREIGPQEVRVSFRSRAWVDVSRLAQEFGGGGHARAAGCTISLPLASARQMVIERVCQLLCSERQV